MDDASNQDQLISITARIVTAFAGNSPIRAADLPKLIGDVQAALAKAISPVPEPEPLVPAVSVKRSVAPDSVTCLECGKKLKSLKRHLHTRHELTPEAYRQKWGLMPDYPMVAPVYAAERSALAKAIGLGRREPVKTARRGKGAARAAKRA